MTGSRRKEDSAIPRTAGLLTSLRKNKRQNRGSSVVHDTPRQSFTLSPRAPITKDRVVGSSETPSMAAGANVSPDETQKRGWNA